MCSVNTVALKFMTDDPTEAEEMRLQFLSIDSVTEVKVLDEPEWTQV